MSTPSVARSRTTHDSQPSTRQERGLQLWRERGGDEIHHVRGTVWAVPSCNGEGLYLVELTTGACTCPDRVPAGETCKHHTAALIAHSKTTTCDGCGSRCPSCELVEVLPDFHDNIRYFDFDRICRPCADRDGVVY